MLNVVATNIAIAEAKIELFNIGRSTKTIQQYGKTPIFLAYPRTWVFSHKGYRGRKLAPGRGTNNLVAYFRLSGEIFGMKLATILTLMLSAAIPLNILAQTSSMAQTATGTQPNGQAKAFPTTNYYRSPMPDRRVTNPVNMPRVHMLVSNNRKKKGAIQVSNRANSKQGRAVQQIQNYLGTSSKTDTTKGYSYQDTISIDGMNRTFQCHLPVGYRSLKNMPIVLVFHGLQLNGSMMVFISQFNPVSDKNGFVVVYGDGVEKSLGRW